MSALWASCIALVIASVAGVMGFGGVQWRAARFARLLFGIFLFVSFVLLIMSYAGVNLDARVLSSSLAF